MFSKKQTQLFDSSKKPATAKKKAAAKKVVPLFVEQGLVQAVQTKSGNGANKLSSTLDPFVDQFGVIGSYKAPRKFSEIEKDCETLWAEEPLNAVKFTGYLRTIPRKVQLLSGETTEEPQLGGEMKHEGIMRMLWLSLNSPETFWKNVGLFVSLGSWHDIFTMLQYDLVHHGWEGKKLDWQKFGNLILTGLSNKNSSELVKKYLPQIKTRTACKTVESQANCMIGKWICSLLFGNKETSLNYKKYRNLKSSGTAHQWQQLISKQKFQEIDFSKIHGRALSLLVKSKFLHNQNLSDKYSAWITKPETVGVKYTGFVHELFTKLGDKNHQETINKQFATLVEKAKSEKKENTTNFIVVRDTSGSMQATATGTTTSCYDIAKALALYFSEFLTGKFSNSFIEFNSDAKMHLWKGKTPVEKWQNDRTSFIGSTNFESVFKLFAKIKNEGVAESEFPTGILCISDSEFNPSSLAKTNVESAKKILRNAGFSKEFVDNFRIVLWNLQSYAYGGTTGKKFETTANAPHTYYFSGYSASVISFLNEDEIKTPRQLFDAAMNQTILNSFEL